MRPRRSTKRSTPIDLSAINLRDAHAVAEIFRRGAEANRTARCRVHSIDRIEAPGTLIATGDIHDNPVHLQKLITAAQMDHADGDPGVGGPHLVLHELIHGDNLLSGMDFSHRALARVAALKSAFPERVHVLLANHELSQIAGMGIVKDGVRVVEVFNDAVDFAFGDDAPLVHQAIKDFVRSMPIALRAVTPRGDILCAHSVPAAAMMQRFDASILSRDLTETDYEPRKGSAHLMVWGRQYDDELLEDLVERWGVNVFILGHEHVKDGWQIIEPCALVLNSDHERGVYLPIDLADPPKLHDMPSHLVRFSEME